MSHRCAGVAGVPPFAPKVFKALRVASAKGWSLAVTDLDERRRAAVARARGDFWDMWRLLWQTFWPGRWKAGSLATGVRVGESLASTTRKPEDCRRAS